MRKPCPAGCDKGVFRCRHGERLWHSYETGKKKRNGQPKTRRCGGGYSCPKCRGRGYITTN